MCGLFSIFPKAGADQLSLRILALFLGIGNVTRGRHSFGVWAKGVAPFRKVGALNDFDNIGDFRAFVFNLWVPEAGVWMAGHTRQATHGGKTVENCHPFEVGNITLAHNGVVTVEGKTKVDHEVDSGQIALSIVEHGWVNGLANVQGSCGLVVSVDDNLVLYRHSQVLHIVEGDWGWAVSSEKNTLREAVVLAGLGLTDPVETPLDMIYAPWDNVLQHAPAKAYSAPASTYRGGEWVDNRWVRDDDDYLWGGDYVGGFASERGSSSNGNARPLPLALVSDAEAKAKHLTPSIANHKEETKRKGDINSTALVLRAAHTLLELGGLNKSGKVKLGKDSRVRDIVIQWSLEDKRFESDYIWEWDKDTKCTVQYLAVLKLPAAWYRSQCEEVKAGLWMDHYAKTLTNIGVTPEEYLAAQTAFTEKGTKIVSLETRYDTCDWCGFLRDAETLVDRNFGCDHIKVCTYCTSDFKASRRGLDWREGKADPRMKSHGRLG